jgi:hypothetical protein
VMRKPQYLRGSSTHNELLSDTLSSRSEQPPLRESYSRSSVVMGGLWRRVASYNDGVLLPRLE